MRYTTATILIQPYYNLAADKRRALRLKSQFVCKNHAHGFLVKGTLHLSYMIYNPD